jgi:hypothetical protein
VSTNLKYGEMTLQDEIGTRIVPVAAFMSVVPMSGAQLKAIDEMSLIVIEVVMSEFDRGEDEDMDESGVVTASHLTRVYLWSLIHLNSTRNYYVQGQ